jgi:SAM-dependent methyltransferase
VIENKNEYVKMDSVEKRHWWYKTLHELVRVNIKSHFHSKKINILDAGCGTGGLLEYLKSNNYVNLSGFDLSADAVEISHNKSLNVKSLNLIDYKDRGEKYDVIISNDTMYFFSLKEQRSILNNFHNSMKNKGIIILNLPSFRAFHGTHDRAVGIQKRFNKKMVRDMVDLSKFEICQKFYWPFLLSPIVLLVRLFQSIKLNFWKKIKIKSDIDMPSSFINNILYKIVGLENKYIKNKPFGSSLLIVLRKKPI